MILFLKWMSTTSTLFCRRREEQSAKLRKTAEKLLLNQLKKHALKNMPGSQQAAVLQQAKQTSTAAPTESEEIPADLLVSALKLLAHNHAIHGWTCPVFAIRVERSCCYRQLQAVMLATCQKVPLQDLQLT